MQNFSLIQLAAEGILMLHYNSSTIFFAKMPPRFFWFSFYYLVLPLLIVGEDIILPIFIKLNPYLFQQVILSERSESNFWEGER